MRASWTRLCGGQGAQEGERVKTKVPRDASMRERYVQHAGCLGGALFAVPRLLKNDERHLFVDRRHKVEAGTLEALQSGALRAVYGA